VARSTTLVLAYGYTSGRAPPTAENRNGLATSSSPLERAWSRWRSVG